MGINGEIKVSKAIGLYSSQSNNIEKSVNYNRLKEKCGTYPEQVSLHPPLKLREHHIRGSRKSARMPEQDVII